MFSGVLRRRSTDDAEEPAFTLDGERRCRRVVGREHEYPGRIRQLGLLLDDVGRRAARPCQVLVIGGNRAIPSRPG